MDDQRGERLLQLARMRRAAAVLGRGGSFPLAARVLRQLAVAGHDAGLAGQSLRAAWQATALTQLDDDPIERVQSLVVLGATLLAGGAARGAVTAGELARHEAERIAGDGRQLALGLAALIEGMGRRGLGGRRSAAWSLHEARERLVAARHAGGAAIALTELGLIDHEDGAVDRALVCFGFARELHRTAGDPGAAARLALAAAGIAIQHRRWGDAALLADDGIADAAAAGDPILAARLAAVAADGLWRDGAEPAAIDAAIERAAAAVEPLAALEPAGADVRLLTLENRIRLAARRGGEEDALRQLEAAFDLGMATLAEEPLTALLDWTVSCLVAGTLPASGWELLARLGAELRQRGLPRLADLAVGAQAQLRGAEPS